MSQLAALSPTDVHARLRFACAAADADALAEDVARTHALVPGHFSLHDGRHAPYALRFRALARDPLALSRITTTLLAATSRWTWSDVTIVSPETAGFLLADHVRRAVQRPHAVLQTDLRRRPTRQLMTGHLGGGAVVVVNDVSVNGESIALMREAVEARGGKLVGVMVFATLDVATFTHQCMAIGANPVYLASSTWTPCPSGAPSCEGCRARTPVFPIAEFA